jgi:hypothetical protein
MRDESMVSLFPADVGVAVRLREQTDIVEMVGSGQEVGRAFEPGGLGRLVNLAELLEPVIPDSPATFVEQVFQSAPAGQPAVIIPIVSADSSALNRVVGFGWADVSQSVAGEIVLTKRQSRIAPANASVALARPLDLDAATLEIVLAEHRRLSRPEVEDDPTTINALLAPALVR